MKKVFLAFVALAMVATSCKKNEEKKEEGEKDAQVEAQAEAEEEKPLDIDKTLAAYNEAVDNYVADLKAGKIDRYNDYDKYFGEINDDVIKIGNMLKDLTPEQAKEFWRGFNNLQNYLTELDLADTPLTDDAEAEAVDAETEATEVAAE